MRMPSSDIQEPAGAAGPLCCMVNRTLTSVIIDTASSGEIRPDGQGTIRHELELVGLNDPHGFKSLVWRMKRQQCGVNGGGAMRAASGAATGMSRDADLVPLLQEQNKLLSRQVELLEILSSK